MIGTILAKQRIPEGIEASNQRNLDKFLKDWADEAVLVYPGDIPGISGTHTGKAAIRNFYESDFEQFPALKIIQKHIAVTNLFDMTGNDVVIVDWEAEAANQDGYRIQNSSVSVMKIKGGESDPYSPVYFRYWREISDCLGSREIARIEARQFFAYNRSLAGYEPRRTALQD